MSEDFRLQGIIGVAGVEGGRNGVFVGGDAQMKGLSIVERTLFESWKGLPWQARLCPKAIEEQENARQALALEEEVTLNPLTRTRSCIHTCTFAQINAPRNTPTGDLACEIIRISMGDYAYTVSLPKGLWSTLHVSRCS